ncbi:MAG: precorrin-2 C(20)-methyltransferase [Pseudomonadota bacterium]
MTGRLFGIGVGPGDPELVTLKAVRLTRAADVVVHLRARGRPSRSRAIMAPHLRDDQPEIGVELVMSPDRRDAEASYDRLAATVAETLAAGHTVAVLCEGDPLLFGTFVHLLERLEPVPDVEIVPGVASPHAAAAAAGWPLATGAASFGVLAASMGADALRQRLACLDAAALIKVGKRLQEVRALLTELGLDADARLVVEASSQKQQVQKLTDWPEARAPYFSVVLTRGLAEARAV